jgi:hypothetical protein
LNYNEKKKLKIFTGINTFSAAFYVYRAPIQFPLYPLEYLPQYPGLLKPAVLPVSSAKFDTLPEPELSQGW